MLKRVTLLVLLIIFAKPVYEYGTHYYHEAKTFLGENPIISDVTIDALSREVKNTPNAVLSNDSSSSVATVATSDAKPPDRVESVEELANAFYYYFSRWETEFQINYAGSTSDIENIIERAVDDAASRDQYIEGHLSDRKIEYEYGLFNASIKVNQQYLTNVAQEQYVNQQVAKILSTVSPETMSDFEKVKFVNDYIVKNTAYSTETVASPHSACAVLQENKGVCQGYALLALKLLQELDVETKYVVGEVYTGGHAWNLVKVDGEWFHLDTTWNDPVPDRENIVSYKYFLATDTQMMLDHTWVQSDYPAATSKKYAVMSQIDHAYELDAAIYYSNVEDDYKLYRLDLTTGENILLSDSRAQYIAGFGEWIYFSNYSNGAYLTKIRTDGTEESTVYREEVNNLFVDDGFLYFSTAEGMKQMEL